MPTGPASDASAATGTVPDVARPTPSRRAASVRVKSPLVEFVEKSVAARTAARELREEAARAAKEAQESTATAAASAASASSTGSTGVRAVAGNAYAAVASTKAATDKVLGFLKA